MKNPTGSSGIEVCGPSSTPGKRNLHPHMAPEKIGGLVGAPASLPMAPPSGSAAVRDSVLDEKGQYKGTGN